MTSVRSICLIGCELSEAGEDPEFDTLGTLLEEDLEEDGEESEVHQTCRRLIEDVWHKKYEREDIANARNHQWTEAASEAVDLDSSTSTPIEILEQLKEGRNFENNSKKLTELFLQQVKQVPNEIAVLDLLIFGRFSRGDDDFITIIKTPYIDDAYNINPDAEDILTENEQVIREQTDKSLLYPRHDGIDNEIDESRVQDSTYLTFYFNLGPKRVRLDPIQTKNTYCECPNHRYPPPVDSFLISLSNSCLSSRFSAESRSS